VLPISRNRNIFEERNIPLHAAIQSLAVANPPAYIHQKKAFDFFDNHLQLAGEERELYRRLLLEGPIKGRYIGVDRYEESCESSPGKLTERFLKYGTLIAAEAAGKALSQAGSGAGDIGALVVNTCTGYLCPGLSSYLIEELKLPPSVKVFDLMGMGCGAAVPNLECAAGVLAQGRVDRVLSISVEICSATAFMAPEPDLIVSNCIFADGASAAVLSPSREGKGLATIEDFESGIFPQYRDHLRYRTETDGRLRNVLSQRVPIIGSKVISSVAERLLTRHRLDVGDIKWWAVHAGGTSVLQNVEKKLSLPPSALQYSYEIFQHYGNMSSPTLMFALEKILRCGKPKPGDKGLLLGFGAGFSGFAALVSF
jgi:alkylresorcinol/alkylpyrone synthase